MKRFIPTVAVLFSLFAFSAFAAGVPVYTVEDDPSYSCWPMLESVGNRLICVYTMGKDHNPSEKGRGTFARTSDDGGRTWSARTLIAQDKDLAQSPVAKGRDQDGAALFWVRWFGKNVTRMALYRTLDGKKFELISEPKFKDPLMQITDVFQVEGVGLMAFWFGGSYADDDKPRWWGVVTSRDNGRTWEQKPLCQYVAKAEWPTEPSAVTLGDGRILVIARCEDRQAQFQITSTDNGANWKVVKTNIDDVKFDGCTPSLVYDRATGIVHNYYFSRGEGVMKVRRAKASEIFDNPKSWPQPETVCWGNLSRSYDSGNANACAIGNKHYIAYYAGNEKICKVLVAAVNEQRDALSWSGRRVVFFGDSITDPALGRSKYWKMLSETMHFTHEVYGVNGHTWNGLPSQVNRAKRDLPSASVDAVFVFLGTNDFNGNTPLGEWWSVTNEVVNCNGRPTELKKRVMNFDIKTFRGRVNSGMKLLRETYPDAQLVLLTPVHRGFAQFGKNNVQPDERYSRQSGLFLDDYVNDLVTAGRIWSAPVIDLYAESALLPNEPWADKLIAHPVRDRLHPSPAGHVRMARLIEARLRSLPATYGN